MASQRLGNQGTSWRTIYAVEPASCGVLLLQLQVLPLRLRPSGAAYCNRFFGAAGKVLEKTQYCDLNLSMERACGNAFETNPWHLEVMTLTTKAIVMSRTSTLDTSSGELTVKHKLMDGIELMQLQGFDARCFRPGGAPEHQLAVHMAGNMFNGFMFQGFLIATIASSSVHDYVKPGDEVANQAEGDHSFESESGDSD